MTRQYGVMKWVLGSRLFSFSLAIAAVTVSIAGVLLRRMVGKAVDNIAYGLSASLFAAAGALGLLYLAGTALLPVIRRRLVAKITASMYTQIEEKVSRLDLMTKGSTDAGEIVTVFSRDVQGIARCIERMMTRLVPDSVSWIVVNVALCLISPYLLLVSVAVSAVPVCTMVAWSTRIKRNNAEYAAQMQSVNAAESGSLNSIELMKARQLEDYCRAEQDRRLKILHRIRRRLSVTESVLSVPSLLFSFVILLALVCTAGYLCAAGLISAGDSLTVVLLSDYVVNAVMSSENSINAIRQAQTNGKRLNSFMEKPESDEREGREGQKEASGPSLSFQEASFSYPGGAPLLNGLSHDFRAGQVHYIVGENGCGKSTLMYLASGTYAPSSGMVRVNGIDHGGLERRRACGKGRRLHAGYRAVSCEHQGQYPLRRA